jgi:hypothetical protein
VTVVAVVAFLSGLLLAVGVMFFGVRRQVAEQQLHHRRWPLALAAFLALAGATLYFRVSRFGEVTTAWFALVLLAGTVAAAGAWWLVKRSSSIPSSDPEDDPRFRFQGHVARVIQSIGDASGEPGRIAFDFDGKQYELRARWSTSGEWRVDDSGKAGAAGTEVVIEIVEGDMAYVEPWAVVEERL